MGSGFVIGGPNPLTQQRHAGVWTPNDPELKQMGSPFPTSGLVGYLPLTEDANDDIGSYHFTNNNSVTFSAAGARFAAASSQWLSYNSGLPATFAYAFDAKVDVGAGLMLSFGHMNASSYYYPVTGILGQTMLMFTLLTGDNGRTQGQADLLFTERYSAFDLTKYHSIVVCGFTTCPADRKPFKIYMDGLLWGCHVGWSGIALSSKFSLGRTGAYNGNYSTGYIRDFRLYNRHLTETEILRMAI